VRPWRTEPGPGPDRPRWPAQPFKLAPRSQRTPAPAACRQTSSPSVRLVRCFRARKTRTGPSGKESASRANRGRAERPKPTCGKIQSFQADQPTERRRPAKGLEAATVCRGGFQAVVGAAGRLRQSSKGAMAMKGQGDRGTPLAAWIARGDQNCRQSPNQVTTSRHPSWQCRPCCDGPGASWRHTPGRA